MLKIIVISIVLVANINYYEACFFYPLPTDPTSSTIPTTTAPKLIMDSNILTSEEKASLHTITGHTGKLTLLWRGTRDGFSGNTFYSKCEGKSNTITIIKSTLNYVFGGYTSISWNKFSGGYKSDASAYLFSLRVNGSSTLVKYPIVESYYAIYNYYNYYYYKDPHCPIFGAGHDIYISTNSNSSKSSYTRCSSYKCPNGIDRYSYHSKFAGSSYFTVAEIEVFQMN